MMPYDFGDLATATPPKEGKYDFGDMATTENPHEGVSEDYDPQTGRKFDPDIPTRMSFARKREAAAKKDVAEPTRGLADRIVGELEGAGETAATVASGLAAGTIGAIPQTLTGKPQSVYEPKTPEGQRNVAYLEEAFNKSKLPPFEGRVEMNTPFGGVAKKAVSDIKEAGSEVGRQTVKALGGEVAPKNFKPVKPEAPARVTPPTGTEAEMARAPIEENAKIAEDYGFHVGRLERQGEKAGFATKTATKFVNRGELTSEGSLKNVPIVDTLAKDDLGILKNEPLIKDGVTAFDKVIKARGKVYEKVKSVGAMFKVPEDWEAKVNTIKGEYSQIAEKFPKTVGLQPKAAEIIDELSGKTELTPTESIELIKKLRQKADAHYKSAEKGGDPNYEELGDVYKTAANVIEGVVEDNLKTEAPGLYEQFTKARKDIAVSYDYNKALDRSTGTINAQKIGKLFQKNEGIMSGNQAIIGRMANAYKDFFQPYSDAIKRGEGEQFRLHRYGAGGYLGGAVGAAVGSVAGVPGGMAGAGIGSVIGSLSEAPVRRLLLDPNRKVSGPIVRPPESLDVFQKEPLETTNAPFEPPAASGKPAPAVNVSPTKQLAQRHDVPTIDLPLRQEVIEKYGDVIDQFRLEQARLKELLADPKTSKGDITRLRTSLNALENRFLAGARMLGAKSAADMHGLRRLLYESGGETQLPLGETPPDLSKLSMPRVNYKKQRKSSIEKVYTP